jgi:hypothetical protein
MKANKPKLDPPEVTEQQLAFSVRGKYAERFRQARQVEDDRPRVAIWAPLVDLEWNGKQVELFENTSIVPGSCYRGYEATEYHDFLSTEELKLCRETEHWLSVSQPVHYELSAAEAVNAFLIALWVIKPTFTHVPLRFVEMPQERTAVRLLDRMQWIEGHAAHGIATGDLTAVSEVLGPLRDVYLERRRLRSALTLTFRGCISKDWQVGFVCFSAAAEAMLTYAADRGVTNRLAMSYAKLTAAPEIIAASELFKRLYGIRSDIVHGRSYDRKLTERNLHELAEFADVLRKMWIAVLRSSDLRTQLEGDDEQRRQFFTRSTS